MGAIRLAVIFLAGVLFAVGLGIGGMTRPENVVGFLDITGNWKPQLMFVMGGAVVVYAIAYQLAKRLERPLLAEVFRIPTRTDVDPRLLGGAVMFGAGWGLSGFCPGPAVVATVSRAPDVLTFVIAMFVGMALWSVMERVTRTPEAAEA